MRIITSTFILFFIAGFGSASVAQVDFVKTSDLNELLSQAKKENKFVMIDGYTDWCGWCKELEKKVFSTQTLGEITGRYFIATRLEMEKDSIGILLSRKYSINSFPTIILLNGDGQLVNVVEGYSGEAEYAKRLLQAIEPSNQLPAGAYSNSYNVDYPQFYADMFPFGGKKKVLPDSAEINQYFRSQPDLSTEANWVALNRTYYWLNNDQFDRIIVQRRALETRYGTSATENLIRGIISSKIYGCGERNDYDCLQNQLTRLEQYTSDGKHQRTFYIERFYSNNQNWEKLAQQINNQLGDSSYMAQLGNLNDHAWAIYVNSNDSFALKSAVSWMKHVVSKAPDTYMYLDTYAALLYKTNRLAEARKYAETAITKGKEAKENTAETEALLKKIKDARMRK
jgi:thioredoxin-related protein